MAGTVIWNFSSRKYHNLSVKFFVKQVILDNPRYPKLQGDEYTTGTGWITGMYNMFLDNGWFMGTQLNVQRTPVG